MPTQVKLDDVIDALDTAERTIRIISTSARERSC